MSFAYKYDPWGVQTLTAGGTGNGAGQNPYAFHAGIKDPGSGLIKFGQRWYNPITGTWTQQDTLDNPLDPANANRYAYAGDDPTNNLDPEGLLSGRELVGSCLVGGGLGGAAGAIGGAFVGGVGAAPGFVGGLLVGCAAGGLANLEAQYGFSTTGQLIDDFGYLRILTDLLGP